MKKLRLRLSEEEIKIIKDTAKKVFGESVSVFIYGSRTDLNKKGGDIDILIKTEKEISLKKQLNFLAELELKGIERKCDLLILSKNSKIKSIHKTALETGVKIL